jgi:hypothetical protein
MAQSTAPEAPHVLRTALPEARPAGAIRFTSWGFDIYDASLWVAPGFKAEQWSQRPLALELHYLRAFDGDDIARRIRLRAGVRENRGGVGNDEMQYI